MARILIIDDEKIIRDLLSEILETAGHETDTASNGKDGIDRIYDPANPEYDMIITDIIMPEKEGIETICEIKKTRPDLKIIAISGGGRIGPDDYLQLAKMIGADEVLKKPFLQKDLLEMVNKVIM